MITLIDRDQFKSSVEFGEICSLFFFCVHISGGHLQIHGFPGFDHNKKIQINAIMQSALLPLNQVSLKSLLQGLIMCLEKCEEIHCK